MESKAFVEGMLKEALFQYGELSWYEFVQRARLQGWINACKCVLKDPTLGKIE